MTNEDAIIRTIDSLYDAIEEGASPGELLRVLAKEVTDEREACVSFIKKVIGPKLLGELETSGSRRLNEILDGISAGRHRS